MIWFSFSALKHFAFKCAPGWPTFVINIMHTLTESIIMEQSDHGIDGHFYIISFTLFLVVVIKSVLLNFLWRLNAP